MKPQKLHAEPPSNYDMAHECLGNAERRSPGGGVPPVAHIEAMAAQTYATLALVDAVHELRELMGRKTTPPLTFRPSELFAEKDGVS